MLNGIDVSSYQGRVDWEKVKNAGIQFAMIRAGYGVNGKDSQFENNVRECQRLGIPFGFYHYSYAISRENAIEEVNNFLSIIKGYNPLFPVVVDMEDADQYKKKRNVSYNTCVEICEVECDLIEKAGYYAMIYANLDWLNNKINSSKLDRFDKWVAQWNNKCDYQKGYGIWQYSSSGIVNGIAGRVDMNISYKDYPSIIRNMKKENNVVNNNSVVENSSKEESYKIVKGDTLEGIAKRFKTTVEELVRINNIRDKNKIYAGNTIIVRSGIKSENKIHVVKTGENLSNIAIKYYGNNNWKKIYNVNKNIIGNNPNYIQVGQKLVIPE